MNDTKQYVSVHYECIWDANRNQYLVRASRGADVVAREYFTEAGLRRWVEAARHRNQLRISGVTFHLASRDAQLHVLSSIEVGMAQRDFADLHIDKDPHHG